MKREQIRLQSKSVVKLRKGNLIESKMRHCNLSAFDRMREREIVDHFNRNLYFVTLKEKKKLGVRRAKEETEDEEDGERWRRMQEDRGCADLHDD